jgi:hypothetical protein
MEQIKKVKDLIYKFDFSNTELIDGNELITTNGVSEFVMNFRKRDLDKGIIVLPSGYSNGLVYKATNGGEIYNNPNWVPDVVKFSFNVYGLKKNAFYRLTVRSRDTGSSFLVTNDRKLTVTNEEKELLLDVNVKNVLENKDFYTVFRTNDNETTLYFTIGKIFINDVILEEVEIIDEENQAIESPQTDVVIEDGKMQLAAYGVFTTDPVYNTDYKGRYVPMTRYTGKGINLYFDRNENQYIIERDNREELLTESFTNVNYIVDINLNKVVNKGNFSQYNICDVSPEVSPNTLKSGYIVFEFADANDKPVKYTDKDSRITILIYRLF